MLSLEYTSFHFMCSPNKFTRKENGSRYQENLNRDLTKVRKTNTVAHREQKEPRHKCLISCWISLHLTRHMHLQLQSMSSKAHHSRFIYYSHSSSYLLFTQQQINLGTEFEQKYVVGVGAIAYLHHASVLWITVHHVIKGCEKVPQGFHEVGLSFVLIESGRRWSRELHWQMITRLLFVSSLCKQPCPHWKWQEFDASLLNH